MQVDGDSNRELLVTVQRPVPSSDSTNFLGVPRCDKQREYQVSKLKPQTKPLTGDTQRKGARSELTTGAMLRGYPFWYLE